MGKLRLDLDAIHVESFEVGSSAGVGTVRGNDSDDLEVVPTLATCGGASCPKTDCGGCGYHTKAGCPTPQCTGLASEFLPCSG